MAQLGNHYGQLADAMRKRSPNLMPGITDPYIVLGLESGASQDEIRERYFALVREHPPERDAAAFKIIRTAYERLRDESTQAETDLFLPQPPPAWQLLAETSEPDLSLHVEDVLTALRSWVERGEGDISDDFGEAEI